MEGTSSQVHYRIDIPDPRNHYVTVTMEIPRVPAMVFELKMPEWLPGAYKINNYARNVESFDVWEPGGTHLEWRKKDKQTWLIMAGDHTRVTLRYEVYAFMLEDDASFVSEDYAIINPGTVCLCPVMYLEEPYSLEINMPERWQRISTGMRSMDDSGRRFVASDYHELLDCPLMLGNHRVETFEVNGIPHDVVIEGEGNLDVDEFVRDIERITRVEIEMMKHVPYDRYVYFLLLTNKDAGLEHRNSTLIFVQRFDFKPRKTYLQTLTIFSHELFHVWNVKGLRPRELLKPDYFNETYTDLLWFSEGFTNYYHNVFLYRSNILNCREFLGEIAKDVFRYMRSPGRFYQSAAESSWDAWIKYYIRDENTNNSVISYYLKGSLIALFLDLVILEESGGKYRLDDLMVNMYNTYFRDSEIGFTYEDVKRDAETLAGINLDAFFEEMVNDRGELPFETYFEKVGLDLVPKDRNNGKKDENTAGGFLGIRSHENGCRIWVRSVERNSPAERGGIQARDEIIALNGYRLESKADLESRLETIPPGTTVAFLVSQLGEIKTMSVTLDKPLPKGMELKMNPDAGLKERELFRLWTGTPFDSMLDETEPEKAAVPAHKVNFVSYESQDQRAPHTTPAEETQKPV